MKACSSSKAARPAKPKQHKSSAPAASTAAATAQEEPSHPCTATNSYAYDPERAANRRVLPYSSVEFKQLNKEKQRRVLRNRETAQMSKARKRAHLQDLQDKEAELKQQQGQLQQQLAVLQEQVAAAAARTHALVKGCSCRACAHLQEQLQQQHRAMA
jgi:hypothetical protein